MVYEMTAELRLTGKALEQAIRRPCPKCGDRVCGGDPTITCCGRDSVDARAITPARPYRLEDSPGTVDLAARPDLAHHHLQMLGHLQMAANLPDARVALLVPPRHGATTVALRFAEWFIALYPQKRLVYATYSKEVASHLRRQHRGLATGCVVFCGVDEQVPPGPIDFLLIDSPHRDARSVWGGAGEIAKLEEAKRWYIQALDELTAAASVGVLMTRAHSHDFLGWLQETQGWLWGPDAVKRFPAISGFRALWPERYGLEELKGIYSQMSPGAWQAMYQQNPVPTWRCKSCSGNADTLPMAGCATPEKHVQAAKTEHPCIDCQEPTLNPERCRDCDLEHLVASGSCRECLTWIIDPNNPIFEVGTIEQQHKAGCSLAKDPDHAARTEEEVAKVREQRVRS